MEQILDRTATRLSIFLRPVEIDKSLPKWCIINQTAKEVMDKSKNNIIKSSNLIETYSNTVDNINREIILQDFMNFSPREFNVYLGKSLIDQHAKKWHSTPNLFVDDDIAISGSSNSDKKLPKFLKPITKLYRKWFNSDTTEKEEEVYEFDVIEFFNKVKGLTKENVNTYIERIKPYAIALKQASDMGQKALAERLTAEIFNNKFESILYANNFMFKITEEQLVNFVKKTEKGVNLCYVKNFIRPIPVEVIEKKKKADTLEVFDNYCVLFYDPEKKAYKQTEAEKERERLKKADPILFGMINGSTNLYYVADWIDEYCDLTLEEFLKVSGIEKQDIEITEKIKLA